MARGITKRQKEVLEFIIDCIRDEGMPPTIAEICKAFGITSTNGANDHLVALERKGYIERSNKARDIRVTEKAAVNLYQSEAATLPLVGRIAAGHPILAEENIENQVPVAPSIAKVGAYCLTVQGDSMIDDGILDGDTIVVHPTTEPRRGEIVVALVEDEATVKRFYPRGEMVELRPSNKDMDTMIFPARDVQIQGKVVALQRTL
jgi:repressor LexA